VSGDGRTKVEYELFHGDLYDLPRGTAHEKDSILAHYVSPSSSPLPAHNYTYRPLCLSFSALVYQVPKTHLPYAVYSVVDNRSGPKQGSRRVPLVEDPAWEMKWEHIVDSKISGAAMDVDEADILKVFSGPRNPTPDLITARQQARGLAGGEYDDNDDAIDVASRAPLSSVVS
jgi:hypothetical protein